MATEGFDAAKAAVDQMRLNDSLKSVVQMTSGQANPLANLSSAFQTATGLKDIDILDALSAKGPRPIEGALWKRRKGALSGMFDGIVTFEWDKEASLAGLSHYAIEHMPHGSAGLPDPSHVQDSRIQEAQIQHAAIQDAPIRTA